MGFILLLVLSAFAVASSAAFFSVYGLAQIFSASFIPVVIMGASLEVGKLVAASYLYRFWDYTPKTLKLYLFVAVFTLMVITSLGIFGFLTAAYQTDSIGLKQQQEQIVLYENQKAAYTERLKGINDDIARTGDDYISKRMELIDKFKDEKDSILAGIEETDAKLLELKGSVLQTEAKIGPIIYVAEVLGESPDKATFWFVLIIIGVFDPLAVSLTLAANIALRRRKEERAVSVSDVEHAVEEIVEHAIHDLDDGMAVVKSSPAHDSNELAEAIAGIKQMINDSDSAEDVNRLAGAVESLNTELRKGRIRESLGTIARK